MRQALWTIVFGLSVLIVFASGLLVIAFLPGLPNPYAMAYGGVALVALLIGWLGLRLSNWALKKTRGETVQPRLPL